MMSNPRPWPCPGGKSGFCTLRIRGTTGFTLVELLIVVVVLSILASMALPSLTSAVDMARVARAIGDVKALSNEITDFELGEGRLPTSLGELGRGAMLDPWGNPYQYAVITGPGQARKDKFQVPINDDFDLYSMGADGKSTGPLTASASRDDIIRANNGGFVGLAENY